MVGASAERQLQITMMYLYVYNNYKGNKAPEKSTNHLIGLALRQYAADSGSVATADYDITKICRTQKGKPYIEDLALHFSVSHSDHLWVCLIGKDENGVDVQRNQHTNFDAIARRFFMDEERLAVERGGVDAFIAIWCRKEAFIKYFGMTIGETLEWLDVAKNGRPVDQLTYKGNPIFFSDLTVNHDYQCVAATSKKEQIWTRKLQID